VPNLAISVSAVFIERADRQRDRITDVDDRYNHA